MPELSLDGFLTKQEIQDQYGRHRRTLTEDVRKALVKEDKELLSLLRVHTQGDKVREGTELSADSLKEFTSQRLNPTVYLHPDFVEKVLQRKKATSSTKPNPTPKPSKQAAQQSSTNETASSAPSQEPPLPEDPQIRSIVLEHLHYSDRKHQEENKDLMDRILQVVETNQELQGQTNSLFNQFQNVLQEGGGVAKVIATSEPKNMPSRSSASSTSKESPVRPAIIIEAADSTPAKRPASKRSTTPKQHRPAKKKKSPAKPPAAPKNRPAKKRSFWKQDVRDFFRR